MKPSFYAVLSLAFLAACSSSTPPEVNQAQQLRQAGNPQQAVAILMKAQSASPNDPAILQQLGYALTDAQQWKDAGATFDRLIALQPSNPEGYNGKAVTLDHMNKHEAAQKLYDKALSISPDAVGIQNNKGMSLILNDQYEEAIPLLEALREKSDSKTIRQNLALAYALNGEKQKAMDLNLQDMSQAEADENMKFYEEYAKKRKAKHHKPKPAADAAPAAPTPLLGAH